MHVSLALVCGCVPVDCTVLQHVSDPTDVLSLSPGHHAQRVLTPSEGAPAHHTCTLESTAHLHVPEALQRTAVVSELHGQEMACVFADSGVEPAHRQHAPARGGVPAQDSGWAATVPFVPSTPRRTACPPPLLPTVLRPASYTRAPRQPRTAIHSCCQTCTVQVMSEQLEAQSKDKGKAVKKLQRVRDACKCVEMNSNELPVCLCSQCARVSLTSQFVQPRLLTPRYWLVQARTDALELSQSLEGLQVRPRCQTAQAPVRAP